MFIIIPKTGLIISKKFILKLFRHISLFLHNHQEAYMSEHV